MILTVFIGHLFGMCMILSRELNKVGYDISTFDILSNFSSYYDVMNKNTFWSNLVLNYVFCGIGGFYIVKDKINKLKNS